MDLGSPFLLKRGERGEKIAFFVRSKCPTSLRVCFILDSTFRPSPDLFSNRRIYLPVKFTLYLSLLKRYPYCLLFLKCCQAQKWIKCG